MAARQKKSKKPSGTKAEQLLEQVTFFVDRYLGRHVGAALREAGLRIELHLDHFKDDTPDEDWIAEVSKRGWVTPTKDKAIRRKPREREAIIDSKARVFTLPSGNMTGEEMAERYVSSKLRMARFLRQHEGPFVGVVGQAEIILVPLE